MRPARDGRLSQRRRRPARGRVAAASKSLAGAPVLLVATAAIVAAHAGVPQPQVPSMGELLAQDEGFEPLLARRDGAWVADGWRHFGPGGFTLDADTGELATHGGMGLYWYAARTFGDFVLELEFRTSAREANSGVFLRVPEPPGSDDYIRHSFEIQIDDAAPRRIHRTGAVYDAEPPSRSASRAPGEWNRMRIAFVGDRIGVLLNGELVVNWHAEPRGKVRDFARSGYIGLQNHDERTTVWFRNLRIRDLTRDGTAGTPARAGNDRTSVAPASATPAADSAVAESAAGGFAAGPPGGRTHRLPATPETVAFGYYWSEAEPVLEIDPGDIVEVDTLITNRPDRLEAAGVPADEVQQSLRDVYARVTDRGPGGHILTGPIYVRGAQPGDVLEVRVLSIELALDYGYNGCRGFLPEFCGEPRTRIIPLDRRAMVGHFAEGIEVPLRPFFGSMGVAPPPDRGRVSSNPPSIHAGNLDNKELVAGTSLYIPVHVPGALFEVGDGHAAQGDGEVDQTAIETSLHGRLQLLLHKGWKLEWPRAETPTHWITMGADEDLTEATRIAVRQMILLLQEHTGLDRAAAYALASVAADLRITELVDGNVGVHMMIAKELLPPAAR